MCWTRGIFTARAVEETVTGLDGVVDLIGACVIVHFPQSKPNQGHLVAAAELDGRSSHSCGVTSENGLLSIAVRLERLHW